MTEQMTAVAPAQAAGALDSLSSELLAAFPLVDPGIEPLGSRVVVQLRQPKKTAGRSGRILLADETKDTEKWNTQVAKIVAIGPVAFRSRSTQELWPEGEWVKVGDFVRVPKYNGDRIEVPFVNGEGATEKALFAIFNDLELIAKVTGDPLAIIAFV